MDNIKRCFVPSCGNTDVNSDKIFISLPSGAAIRKSWCLAVGKTHIFAATGGRNYCCEDHFNMTNDCENWMEYKFSKVKLRMKKGIVPHRNLYRQATGVVVDSQLSPESKKRKIDNMDTFKQKYGQELQQCLTLNKGVQVEIKKITVDRGTNTSNIMESKSTSPFKMPKRRIELLENLEVASSSSSPSTNIGSDYCKSESDSSENVIKTEELKQLGLERIFILIEENSRFYLGLPSDVYFLIKLLENEAKISHVHILIILKKLRLNDPYVRLALDFGYSTAFISKVFNRSLYILATYFKTLIFWPRARDIITNLPIPFRYRYRKVQSIIDCLEIQIEQPSEALHQALTWSNYKKMNTLKYLISSTPDGLINFISEGFGGRISDTEIVEASSYMNVLPDNCDVMADRGFKSIGGILHRKNCNLIRPPSVLSKQQSSKDEVKESKRIASLRIHIERVIRRLREFSLFNGHACINHQLISKVDYCIIIACGIINLQGPLIK